MRIPLFLPSLTEITHTVHQFLDVFLSAQILGRAILIHFCHDARTAHQFHTYRIGILLLGHLHKLRNQVTEALQFGVGTLVQCQSVAQRFAQHLPQTHLKTAGCLRQFTQRRAPDATCRIIDDPLESLFIVRIHHHPEISHDVFHFLALVERQSPIDTVRNTALAQRLFEDTALGIRTVKDGTVVIGIILLRMQLHNLIGHNLSFFHVAVGCKHPDRLPFVLFRKDILPNLVTVFRNQAVGRIDNGLRGTVILFQLEQTGIFIGTGKIQDVVDVGPTEGIDALCIVAHHAHELLFLRKLEHNAVLGKVRVLVLVHQNITETCRILVADVRTRVKQ
ncbi:putative uncharacterized protein [Bacteroides sp. CAG:875]|nr:putative uncharacterized protein [Bacteroides sp. CAG:875]